MLSTQEIAVSYEWGKLIEHQAIHIANKAAEVLGCDDSYSHLKGLQVHEMILRAIAEEGRAVRVFLTESHKEIISKQDLADRIRKLMVVPNRPKRAYMLMSLKMLDGHGYEEYRAIRRASLFGYYRTARLRGWLN